MRILETPGHPWPAWQRILFRFFFAFYCLFLGPWEFLSLIPLSEHVLKFYNQAVDAVAGFFNRLLFHITPATKPPNGNGDYPEQWMIVATCGLLALVGCIVWSVIDRKRKEYYTLNYWFSLVIRYFLVLNGFIYGIIKLFGLQMPFPNLSQLATPLGDYMPMRFSWLFVGYSFKYQFFSGAIELVAALLLLFRRTATLGVLVAFGVFFNVMMLNLSYDIPVKINSISLVVLSFYLLVQELPRLYQFFFLNQAILSRIFVFPFETRNGRIIARSAKWLFIAFLLYSQLNYSLTWLSDLGKSTEPKPFKRGIYDVTVQTRNGDTLTAASPDSVYWQNVVFDLDYYGSVKTTDSRFRHRYGRAYFGFTIDSATKQVAFKRFVKDSVDIVRFTYNIKDSTWLELQSFPQKDSMYVLLRKRHLPFPLAEKQFHWVSETNR